MCGEDEELKRDSEATSERGGRKLLRRGIQREEVFKMGSQGQGGLSERGSSERGSEKDEGATSEEGGTPRVAGSQGVEGAKR